MPDPLTPEELVAEHAKLRRDFDIVRAYGEEHPDEWTEALCENEPTVRIIVLVAGSRLERHERALRELVSHPHQLDVRQAKFARRRLEEIVGEVRPQWRASDPGTFLSMGIARGTVTIQVRADQEHLAAALIEQYGDALSMKVGAFDYPIASDRIQDETSNRDTRRSQIPPISKEQLNVILIGELTVISGRNQNGVLEFTNNGPTEVVLDTNGVVTAQVVEPATGDVVGGFVGAQTAQLIQYVLPSMTPVRVPFVVGTASVKRELGYAVPPGNWMVDAIVTLHDGGERRLPLLPIVILGR
ncbi:MAG TPA: hypothetical protein VGZ04_12055 [Acidimicrobiales bacterium]|jgi:hypothetical protein|nr:hypothetical protein [Acidimicrobiales bacterium]